MSAVAYTASHPPFRRDIQGLRAVAVVAVVLDHALGWPSGGFVGVDVFFVISGFLITGLLVREHTRNGRISIRAFYGRRVRRIVPAAAAVLVTVLAAAALLTPGAAFRRTVVDAAAAALSAANWRFAATGTDYFAQTGTTSPLQHFWSLAVEEQFYLVWPLLLALLLTSAAARGVLRRRAAAVALVGMIIASFAFACWQTTAAPTVAYFSTFTRAWELGAGALLALAAPRLRAAPAAVGRALAWGGLVLIGASFALVAAGPAFPAPGAALPVLGAVLVIAGGCSSGSAAPVLLTNRVAVHLGAVSYSWYLWHFPVLILLEGVAVEGTRRTVVGLVVGLLLAELSYRLIERPALGWRKPGGARPLARGAKGGLAVRRRVAATAAAVLLTVAAGGVLAPAVQAKGAGTRVDPAVLAAVHAVQPPGTPAASLERGLLQALGRTTWPALRPSAAEVSVLGSPVAYDAQCSATVVADPRSCAFGASSGTTIVVVGDSLGITLLPTVVEAFGASHPVRGLTRAGCAVTDVNVQFADDDGRRICRRMQRDAIDYVVRTRPALVLLIENSSWAGRLASGATGVAATDEWRAGVQRTVDALRRGGSRVAVVSPSPDTGTGIAECATPGSSPAACITIPPPAWQVARAAESSLRGADYIDTSHWFCVQDVCPAFSGTTPLKRDFVHPTVQYAHRVVPDFQRMVGPLLAG